MALRAGDAATNVGRSESDREQVAADARAEGRRKYRQLPAPVSEDDQVTTHDDAPPPEPGFDPYVEGGLRWAGWSL
ncbi:MAG TPA: hypothetical protein VMW94_03915 [Actinomycetes bacterium]|nr:hypothetical protein [Actinomycetes bacterium]